MSASYTIGIRRGNLCLIFTHNGKRRKYTLGTNDEGEAKRLAPALYLELTKPKTALVWELWRAYVADKRGRAVLKAMKYTWPVLEGRFGRMQAGSITIADSRAHTEQRRASGIKDGTIYTELTHLRTVLNWAVKHGYLTQAPYIEIPPQSKPKHHYLTKLQARALINAADLPHTRLFIILALTTGGRNAALLDLTWDRCDFSIGMVDLRNPDLTTPHKGRAIIPMNQTLRRALLAAREAARSDYVVEWRGQKVLSLKRSMAKAAKEAGLIGVSPHVLRHSTAVHMAEGRVSMDEIAQFMGHKDVGVTRKIYARYSPDFLREAAKELEYM